MTLILPGAVIPAADISALELTPATFTPTWTASTTNPTNFTAEGWKFAQGKFRFIHLRFTPGASFTAGSGGYRFGLGEAASASLNAEDILGVGFFRDTSASARYYLYHMLNGAGSTTVIPMYSAGTGLMTQLTNTAPVAPANGDYITATLTYWVD